VSGAGYAEVSNNNTSGVTLTNDGTFETLGASVSADYIDFDLTNNSGGKLSIGGANTVEANSANITNNGTFIVTASGALSAGGAGTTTFTDSGGSLDNKGTLSINDVTFTQSGGKLSGHAVMVSDFSTLDDSAGTGSFSLVGDNNLSGTIPAGQTVTVLGTPSNNGSLVLAGDVTNDGTLVLDSQSISGGYAALSRGGSPVTLTNNGIFKTVGATVSSDEIGVDFTNRSAGTVTISGASTTGEPGANITNNGSFTVTSKASFAMTGGSQGPTTFTDSGGSLVDNGSVSLNGVIFVQSGGVESGHAVALTDSSTLTDSAGGGSFSMIGEDFLSGTVPVGQTITVLGTASDNSTADLTSNVVDDGNLVLDSENVSAAGYAQYIGDALTVNGTLKTLGGNINDNIIGSALTIEPGGLVSISGQHNLADSGNSFINNEGGTFAIGDNGNISLSNNAAYNSSPQSTYAVTLDPNDAVYPFIGDANQQGFSGTLKIRAVGTLTAGERFGLVGGDANTINENFTAFNFGTGSYDVTTAADNSAVYATVVTPPSTSP
jgi:hypothetical protein